MALVATEDIIRAGLEASYTNVAASHTVNNDGSRVFLHVVNGGTSMVLTLVSSGTSDGLAIADRTITIGSSEEHFVFIGPTSVFGTVTTIQFDDQSDGTVAVLRVPAE